MSKTIIESPSDLYDLVGTTLGREPQHGDHARAYQSVR